MLDLPAPTRRCALPIVRDPSTTAKRAVAAMFDENRSGIPRLSAPNVPPATYAADR